MMNPILLDAVDATLSNQIWWLFGMAIAVTVIIEMLVMLLMKYNHWKKCLLDAFIVNIASLVTGIILLEFFSRVFNKLAFLNIMMLFLITLVVEGGLLFLLNRVKPFSKTAVVTIVMNIVTYALFILFFRLI